MQKKNYPLIKKLSNIWNFMTLADSEYLHSKAFNISLFLVYFLQLFSL
jgi:hypothetical protein